jgi:L-lactate utilization protein LutB
MEQLIGSVIVAIISGAVTLVTSHYDKKDNRMHAARQSILQLIMEDKLNVIEGKIPENKENILAEYDEYRANKGNSYVHDKIEDYLEWYDEVVKKLTNKSKSKGGKCTNK